MRVTSDTRALPHLQGLLRRYIPTQLPQCQRPLSLRLSSVAPEAFGDGPRQSKWKSKYPRGPAKKSEELKPERFSKDGHLYKGEIGIGTYSWGDRRDGWFNGEYPSSNMERSQLSCGAFNEQDIEEAFACLEESGLPMFDAREMYPCENVLGEVLSRWKKRQLKLQAQVKQIRPFLATSYQARPVGRNLFDLRGGRGALIRALEASLERLQATRIDLYQVSKPSSFYWGGERSIFEALAQARSRRLVDHVGLIGYTKKSDLKSAVTKAKEWRVEIKSNSFELSLASPQALVDGTIEACRELDIVPFANRPLAGGLAAGTYTVLDPNGGKNRKPRYTFPDLEPLYPVHKALRAMAGKYTDKLGKRVGPVQVSVNWVRGKGALPIVGVKTAEQARDMVEATKWNLEPEDVQTLEDVALDTYKRRKRVKELLARVK